VPVRHLSFGDVLREHRRRYADRIALVDGDIRLTWPEADDRVNRLANALRAVGVEAGDRVLWLGQNSFRIYELLGAVGKLGAMVCPGYWRWSAEETAFAIADFRPKVIIWQQEEIGDTVAAARERASTTALWLRHDDEGPGSYEELLAAGDAADPGIDVDPDTALLVIYTAAMDGRPCGSMLSHTNLLCQAVSTAWLGDIDHTTAFLNSGPMFHIGNYQFWGLPTFVQGGKNVVVKRVWPPELLPALADEHCTHAYLMPPTIVALKELNATLGKDLSNLRASVAAHLWEGAVARDTSRYTREGGGEGLGYGQTEVTGFCTTGGYGGRGLGNAGRPGPFVRVGILDANGHECPPGEAGEICVRGDLVHLGYWNRPEVNTHRFRFGWWHTTDLGRREADGTISFLGTMTRMLKTGAENVFPAEVENCLESHHAVREAAVIGVPNERWAQDVKAVVALHDGASATAAELIEHCRAHIASYKKPKSVEFVDALPRVNGYVTDYAALDEKFGGGGYPGADTMGAGR
jgi:acyl-CoA synthetase (AMP-forming)/AMP-acid ligase II